MSYNLNRLNHCRDREHSKKTIEDIKRELLQHNTRFTRHQITLPLNLIQKLELQKQSSLSKYLPMCNEFSRRNSLRVSREYQSKPQLETCLNSSAEIGKSMVIMRPSIRPSRKESEDRKKLNRRYTHNSQILTEAVSEVNQLPGLPRFQSQRIESHQKVMRAQARRDMEISPW